MSYLMHSIKNSIIIFISIISIVSCGGGSSSSSSDTNNSNSKTGLNAPTNLTVELFSQNNKWVFALSWTDNSGNEAGTAFDVRPTKNAPFQNVRDLNRKLIIVGENVTKLNLSYNKSEFGANQLVGFRVVNFKVVNNTATLSGYSNTANVSMP